MKIPEGVKVSVEGPKVKVSGPQGALERTFHPLLCITVSNDEVGVGGMNKAMTNTTLAHLRNMFVGVTSGFEKKLKMIYAHFPMTIEVKGQDVTIKNFLGEKQPRKAKVAGITKVQVKGQEVTISGPSRDDVGATYSNIKRAIKIRKKDGRVFQDGLYPAE